MNDETALGSPVRVDERPGHLWFPTLHAVGEEEVLCVAAITHDQPQGVWPAAAYLSRNGGRSWRWVPEITDYALASVRLGPRDLLLLPYALAPTSQYNYDSAFAIGTRVTLKGNGILTTACHTIRFHDLPREVDRYPHGGLRMVMGGNVVVLAEGTLWTNVYARCRGDQHYSLWGMVSRDNGCTWSFRGSVVQQGDLANTEEGPSESSTLLLPEGTLACVYRIGSGVGQEYHRSESLDGGHHWTTPRPLQGMGSVKPQWIRFDDGTLFLTGGRPGLTLWRSQDDQTWDSLDLMASHNNKVRDHTQRFQIPWTKSAVTTSYTSLCLLNARKALVCYDRLGNGWRGAPGPHGATDTIFCVSIER